MENVDENGFPLESTLERSENNELIYGGSIAINEILKTLMFDNKKIPKFKIFAINLYTLFANVYNIDDPLHMIADRITYDFELLKQFIKAYNKSIHDKPEAVVIYTYSPEYKSPTINQSFVPNEKTKKGKKQVLLEKDYGTFKRLYLPRKDRVEVYEDLTFYYKRDMPRLTHGQLITDLNRIGRRNNFYNPNIALISHVMYDYHVIPHLKTIQVLERYTGKLNRDFSKKIDPSKLIPFNRVTHAIFGDGTFLKSNLTNIQKRELRKLAKKDNWKIRTEPYIKDKIYSLYPDLAKLNLKL